MYDSNAKSNAALALLWLITSYFKKSTVTSYWMGYFEPIVMRY